MRHYTYITRLKNSEKYYVGRHSTKKPPDIDNYRGSGKWVRSIKNKELLEKEILKYYDTVSDLIVAERCLLSEHVGNVGCMNFNRSPVGFSVGDLNPSRSEDRRELSRKRFIENNPMTNPENRIKSSLSQRGRQYPERCGKLHSEETKAKISAAKTGSKLNPKFRNARIELSKKQYLEKSDKLTFSGNHHSDKTKNILSEKAKSRPFHMCQYCEKYFKIQTLTRWHGENCKMKDR